MSANDTLQTWVNGSLGVSQKGINSQNQFWLHCILNPILNITTQSNCLIYHANVTVLQSINVHKLTLAYYTCGN